MPWLDKETLGYPWIGWIGGREALRETFIRHGKIKEHIWFPVSIFPQTNPWSHLTWGVHDYEMMAMSAPGQGTSSKNIPKKSENNGTPFLMGSKAGRSKKNKNPPARSFSPAGIKMIFPQMAKNSDAVAMPLWSQLKLHFLLHFLCSFASWKVGHFDDVERISHSQKMWNSTGSSLTPPTLAQDINTRKVINHGDDFHLPSGKHTKSYWKWP